jgi:hypothetical protein
VKLLTKLTLLALAVSALPVAIAGWSSLRIGQSALRGALEQNELTVAKQVAGYASSHIENMLSMLRVDARILDLTRSAQNEPPSAQALNQVLWLVYHQNDDFCAVAMFDEHGALIGKPASLEDPSRYESLKSHEPMRPTDVEGVGLMAPLGAALSSGQGIGPIFLGGPLRLPHVVLAVAFDPSYGGGKRILAAEVSLKRLANYVASLSTPDIDVKLLDGRGRLFAAGSSPRVDKLDPQRVPGAREGELPAGELVAEYVNGNRHLIGAYAPVTPWGLGAVVDKTVADALRPVDRIRLATLFWMAISVIVGSLAKNATPSSTDMFSTSSMVLPRNVTSSVSLLKRAPLHAPHVTSTSGMKYSCVVMVPSPWHSSHRPPLTLKLKRPGLYSRSIDRGACVKRSRMVS